MTNHPMMKCGHAANATCEGKPVCAICAGIKPGAREIDENAPSFEGRVMECHYRPAGHADRPSDPERGAFFESRPDRDKDAYYCGCKGWD